MVELIDGFSTDGVSIGPGVINSHKLTINAGQLYRAIFVMNDISRQEFSMKFWVSRRPGDTPLGPNKALGILSIGKQPSEVYIGEETADISGLGPLETIIIDPNIDIPSKHSRDNAVLHQAGPWVLLETAGDFYLNVKNYDGTTNNYKLLSDESV